MVPAGGLPLETGNVEVCDREAIAAEPSKREVASGLMGVDVLINGEVEVR